MSASEYKINPSAFSSMVPVPAQLIDDNLKLAGACQLKTALFFCRRAFAGENPTVEQIAAATGYDAADVEDALIFWVERGLLIRENEALRSIIAAEPETNQTTQMKPKREVENIPIVRPSHEQLAERLAESDEIQILFREAQEILGKTIGFSGQSTLLMIHDSYGLSVDVLLMLLQFAKETERTGMSQISYIAKSWAENEILSIDRAEEYINGQLKADEMWSRFRMLSGVQNETPTTKQRQYMLKWKDEYHFDVEMIFAAYERTVEQTGKFSLPYADKILKSWHSMGFKNIKAVEESEKQHIQSKAEASKSKASKPAGGSKKQTESVFSHDSSYDLSKLAVLGLKKGGE